MQGVTLQAVSRRFGPIAAVDSVDLAVAGGEFLTLLGPSGCGKTTTLRMIAGLDQNDGGIIRIGDSIVSDAKAGFFVPPERRNLGMVFQSYAIWPHMTVFDNVAYPMKIRRRSGDEIRRKVRDALRLVEMEDFAERPAPALSGGQQQRVAIARALVFEPQVLLLDEPLSNLDARLRLQMGDEFRALQRRLNITTIYVTHDQEEAMALSDRIVVMQRGKILQLGTPEILYHRPANAEVAAFFGSPNLLKGRVVSSWSQDGRHYLAVEGQDWQGHCLAQSSLPAGTSVTVMVRPEDVLLSVDEPRAENGAITWQGRIINSVFRGSHRSIDVAVGERMIRAEIPSSTQTGRMDAAISLSTKPDTAWAFPDALNG